MLDNETNISIPIPPKETTKPMGPGSRLRRIREARHFDLNEMAKRIRLSHERLIQLESDDYFLMGAPAFAKGYLRSYANQLGLAQEEITSILQAFDELELGTQIQHNKPELINEKINQVSPKTTRWIGYLIVIVLLGSLGYVLRTHFMNNNGASPAGTDKASTTPVATNANPPVETTATTAIAIPDKAESQITSQPTQSSDAIEEVEDKPAPAATKANTSRHTKVKINPPEE